MKAFLKNVSLRNSCFSCYSKSINRNSDITLADLWGEIHIVPDMFDDKGTSFVVINSQKGKYLFDAVNASLNFKEIKFEDLYIPEENMEFSWEEICELLGVDSDGSKPWLDAE